MKAIIVLNKPAVDSQQSMFTTSATLDQNIPNPFDNTTTVSYTLPRQYASARIIVSDKSGRVIKEINISGSGKGSLQVNASSLVSGTYQYSLVINGKLISTRQMLVGR